jgi:hypothetical protein
MMNTSFEIRLNTIGKLLLAVLLFSLKPSAAQTESAIPKNKALYGGIGHLTFSEEQLNLKGLNKTLTQNGYGTLNNYSQSFGGGGSFVIKNIVLGGGGAWLKNIGTQNSINSVSLKGGYGYFSMGYIAFGGRQSLLFPQLGIGGGGYTMQIQNKRTSIDFSQQLNSPAGVTIIETGGWMANLELTYLYFLNRNAKEGFCFGIKAGYKYAPNNWTAKDNGVALANSPKINMNGFFVSVLFGGGSVSTNQ